MATVVSICNLALSRIGDRASVSSIDPPDGSSQAVSCARMYPLALGALLDMHNWGFATRVAKLAERSDYDGEKGVWEHCYSEPAGCRRVIALEPYIDEDAHGGETCFRFWKHHPHMLTPRKIEFELMADKAGHVILTNLDDAACRYIISEPKPSLFPSLFADALSWLLATYLAGLIIRSNPSVQYAQLCNQQFQLAFDRATKWDARQRATHHRHLPPWILRRGWR